MSNEERIPLWVENAAREVAFVLNESHRDAAPIGSVTQALLDDAQDLGDIVDEFASIIAPVIYVEFKRLSKNKEME